MVWKTGVKRIKGGKTLKIDLKTRNNYIEDIVISGDFFAYPEEVIDLIEEELRGKHLSEVDTIINKYRDRVELIGLTFDDIRILIHELMS